MVNKDRFIMVSATFALLLLTMVVLHSQRNRTGETPATSSAAAIANPVPVGNAQNQPTRRLAGNTNARR